MMRPKRTTAIQGAVMKRMGYVSGHPDVTIYETHGGYHGLMIEMKASDGKLRDNQEDWLQQLGQRGWRAVCCYGFEEARKELDYYFSLPCTR